VFSFGRQKEENQWMEDGTCVEQKVEYCMDGINNFEIWIVVIVGVYCSGYLQGDPTNQT